jgi:hypothetical protein
MVGIISAARPFAFSSGPLRAVYPKEELMTTIDMSDGRPKEPRRLRELAAWYRVFAEEAGNPVVGRSACGRRRTWRRRQIGWKGGRSLDNKAPRIFGDKQRNFSAFSRNRPIPGDNYHYKSKV